MIVATAGHIDHGKTTLVRALTGIDTDRLPEEKTRGISIDIGFAHCMLEGGEVIGFVDVPGHERFVRNMLSGVYAVGHVLLVVAADDGVMPQTREHLRIVDLLGVAQGAVVITKKDRVDAARIAAVAQDALELLEGTALEGSPVFAVSAVTGDGMDALRGHLRGIAALAKPRIQDAARLTRFVVDRVFTVAGSGTVVTGTVIAGGIRAGDSLVIAPAGTQARVRKLQRHGAAVERALPGERCAINLANVEQGNVSRGDWLVAPDAAPGSDCLDVRIKVLPSEAGPLMHWTPVHLHIGAADIPARVSLRRGASIAPGQEQVAQLRLARPVHAAHGDRLILRDQSATRTLGGGVVIDPFPTNLRRAQRTAVIEALSGTEVREDLEALLSIATTGVKLEWVAHVFNLSFAAVLAIVPQGSVVVVEASGHIAFSGAEVARLRDAVAARVQRFHAERKNADGMEIVALHAEVARAIDRDVFTGVVKHFAAGAGLQLKGSRIGASAHDSTDNPRDLQLWQRLRPLLQGQGATIPSVRELAAMTGAPLQQVRDLVHRKAAHGELSKLTAERFALPATLAMLREKASQVAESVPGAHFSAAQYRDAIGTGRGLAIEILEHLDRLGATQRRGDNLRAMRETTTARALDLSPTIR
ncbi:MAG: selenocysteine-specific translation elongation factor [Pseudomonadota bacterium]